MELPFTGKQFFDVIAAYNSTVWPAQFALIILGVALVMLVLRAPERAGRIVSAGLAFLWVWLALAYHLAFFWTVNPAAPAFATVSLGAAIAFIWFGVVKGGLRFEQGMPVHVVLGLLVVMFALVIYPAIGEFIGHRYPAAPTFGLPCPTTIFTFGLLLMASPGFSKALVVGPLIWAVIGATAAFAFDVTQDLGLVVVAVLGVYLLVRRVPLAPPLL